jgi:SAM-dependent methyltransferase
MQSYWSSLAHSYAMMGPPLRPSSEDVQRVEAIVAEWAATRTNRALQGLILGVTPDIANMHWPASATLVGLDSALPMTQAVWPGNIPHKRWAVCGSWQAIPRAAHSCDVVLGDGAINCVRYPTGSRGVAAEACRVLREDGILVLRCYVQPAVQESPEDVIDSLRKEPDPSFHHFKLRLLMAMQPSAEQGVAVDDVYRFWARQRLSSEALEAQTGWDRAAIETIEMYRETDTVHTFLNSQELETLLAEFFDVVSVSTPFLETCQIWVLKLRRLVDGDGGAGAYR